jgi:ABC-type antimicrobial peptide transport system permease subunit
MIGAMITMYAAVANRVGEIGTLRALGFRRSAVLTAFLLESILLGAIGGVVGIALASVMQFVQISTLNWQSFAELAFTFTLTPGIAMLSFGFAIVMGVVGGFLPAVRAARLSIIDALRAA